MTLANLKSRYRNTASGFLWVILNPLILYGVQSYIFRTVLNIRIQDYSLFLLSGLLPWIFINQSLEMSASILVNSGKLLKSYPINPIVCLLAQIIDNTINFLAGFLLIFAFTILFAPVPIGRLAILPVPVLLLFVSIFSLSWLLATVQVFFRDTRFLLTFVLNISFFLTPIFYPPELIPAEHRWLLALNPFNHIIAPFRAVVHPASEIPLLPSLVASATLAFGLFLVASYFWRKTRNAVFFNL
ncbi:MAG: ABC transporter permease [Oligoflexia bacterium]|nr:ABC transporter permease [Oligoflexia bacterium]